MNTLKKIFLMFAAFQMIGTAAQAQCNSINSPTFQVTTSQATLATNGVCSMQVYIVNANTNSLPGGPVSFSFISPGGVPSLSVIPTIAGIWTVTVIDNTNNCVTSQTVQVNSSPAPTVSITANQNSVCVNETIQLTAQGANTYTWNNSATGSQYTTAAFTTTGNVTYSVQLQGASSAGCVATNTISISVLVQVCETSNVGITECSNSNQIKIYPNPVNEILNVEFETINTEIKVVDVLGKEMLSVKNTKQINVIELPKGVYFIRIENEMRMFLKE